MPSDPYQTILKGQTLQKRSSDATLITIPRDLSSAFTCHLLVYLPEGLGILGLSLFAILSFSKGCLHGLRGTMLVSPEKEALLTEVETPFSLVTLRDSLVQSLLMNPMSDIYDL